MSERTKATTSTREPAALPPARQPSDPPRRRALLLGGLGGAAMAATLPDPAVARGPTEAKPAAKMGPQVPPVTHYRTASIDGINLFYREAGRAGDPTVVLLHGFPTSSHMFRNLIPALADGYHLIAPDYPGF